MTQKKTAKKTWPRKILGMRSAQNHGPSLARFSAPGFHANIFPHGLFTVSLDGLRERGTTCSLSSTTTRAVFKEPKTCATACTRLYHLYVGLPNFLANHKATNRIYRMTCVLLNTDLYSFCSLCQRPTTFSRSVKTRP